MTNRPSKFQEPSQLGQKLLGFGLSLSLGMSGLAGCQADAGNSASSRSSSSLSSETKTSEVTASQIPEGPKATLTDFLRKSLEPKDQVLYIWGGGWNEEDTAGGIEANTIGMAPAWKTFYEANLDGYNALDHAYEVHDGLDCSGYLGWVLYNTLNEKRDYVVTSDEADEFLTNLGLGTRKDAAEVTEILPGDIMTTEGHVYIALGQFEDGSVLLMHSSPPGVRMSGTSGIAYETALLYQNNGWDPLADQAYLHYDQFRFSDEAMPDPDHLREMTTDQVVDFLYGDPGAVAPESTEQAQG